MSYYELRSGGLGDTGLGDAAAGAEMNILTNQLTYNMQQRDQLVKQLATQQDQARIDAAVGQAGAGGNAVAATQAQINSLDAELAQIRSAIYAAQTKSQTATNVGVGMTMTVPGTQMAPNAANVNALLPIFTGQQQRQPAAASGGLSTGAMIGIGAGALTLLTVVMLLARRGG